MEEKKAIDSSERVIEELNRRFQDEVNQANVLLEWAISVGIKDLELALISGIKKGQELISQTSVGLEERTNFETAYYNLAQRIGPVTWKTFSATSDRYGRRSVFAPIVSYINKGTISHARIWSRTLWFWTIFFILLVLIGENLQEYLDIFSPADSESVQRGDSANTGRLTFWLSKIVPFLYGALGSCAFLLRSCHKFMYARTFDPRRLPEYYNRILLGFLAGGTILLYINPESTPQKVGATALAFLAGYSTDFLFTTIERVAAAVLPKKVAEAGAKEETVAEKG
jgi:hypothetical protein